MKKIAFLISTASLLFLSFVCLNDKKTTIYLVGDSTIAKKEVRAYPETGWGMPFSIFFDSTVVVQNHAKNGRSSRTFFEEGLWKPIIENLKEGDYVFIQFGHNDEVPSKKSYTTEEQFTNHLSRYITESRSKKAIPILITPVARRKFDSTGHIVGTHDAYSELVRMVARQQNVPLIDLDKLSQALLQEYGAETSKLLFNHLKPGEHPNYPNGKMDDTHFNELGARKMAELVLAEIKRSIPALALHIHQPSSK